jgi:hypothetical protein
MRPSATLTSTALIRSAQISLSLGRHFKEEFVEREEAMLKNGTGLIFPLPTIHLVKN